jgi:hypothetical protein
MRNTQSTHDTLAGQLSNSLLKGLLSGQKISLKNNQLKAVNPVLYHSGFEIILFCDDLL